MVVVDDDEALSSLLIQTLDTHGYSTRFIADGEEAVEMLAGDNPSIQAKVILLDVGLPSLDGIGVLRRLGQDGILRRTRVVTLTARTGEDEVMETLNLGAVDHVAKPFSVSVLMQRVSRAMEA